MDESDGRNMPSGALSDAAVIESACSESRNVLDHQLTVQADIDDKAVWTVRTSVLVIGLLLSAGSIGNVSLFLSLPWFVHVLAGLGLGALLLSVFLGIGTYTMTQTYPGVSHRRRIEVLRGRYDSDGWRRRLLEDHHFWIAEQEAWNEQNGFYLFLAHTFLLAGTTAIVLAGITALFLTYTSYNGVFLLLGFVGPILTGALLLWAR